MADPKYIKQKKNVGDLQFWENVWSWKTKAIHLTKAKEIIKKLMEFAEMDDREYEEEYKEAEQFLMEE